MKSHRLLILQIAVLFSICVLNSGCSRTYDCSVNCDYLYNEVDKSDTELYNMLRIDTSIEKLVHFDTNFIKGNPYLCDLNEKLCEYVRPMMDKGVALNDRYGYYPSSSAPYLIDEHSTIENGLKDFPFSYESRMVLATYDDFMTFSLRADTTDAVFLEAESLWRRADSVFTLVAFFLISLGSPYHEIDHYLPSGHFYIVVRDGMHYKAYWDRRSFVDKSGDTTRDRTPILKGEWFPSILTPHSPGFGKSKDL